MLLIHLPVRPLLTVIFVLVLPVVASAAARHTTLKFDPANWHGYVQELIHTRGMESRRILSEIEDGPRELARARVAAKHAGIPLTVTDLRGPLPLANENAAPIYAELAVLEEQYFKSLIQDPEPAFFDRNWDYLTWRKTYTPQQIAIIKDGMARKQAVIGAIHEVAGKPYCVFTTSDNDVLQSSMSAYLFDAGSTLNTESYLSAHDGDYADAVANARWGIAMARHAESFRRWLQVIAIPIEYLSMDSIDNILHMGGTNVGALRAVNVALADDSPTPSFRHDYVDDEPSIIDSLEAIRNQGPDYLPTVYLQYPSDTPYYYNYSRTELRLFFDMVDALEAASIRVKIKLAPHADDDYKTKASLYKAANNALVNPDGDAIERYEYQQLGSFVTDFDYKKTELLARRNVFLAADQALSIKAATGRFPQALPRNYMDPFANKPLLYKLVGDDGFMIQTINPGMFWLKIPPRVSTRSLRALEKLERDTDMSVKFEYPGPKPVPATDSP